MAAKKKSAKMPARRKAKATKKKGSPLERMLRKRSSSECLDIWSDVKTSMENLDSAYEDSAEAETGYAYYQSEADLREAKRDLKMSAAAGMKKARSNKCPSQLIDFIKHAAKSSK